MKNGNALIGLFQGLLQNNILTFNPDWDENANAREHFDDIGKIQQELKEKGISSQAEAHQNTRGPSSFVLPDPVGNTILANQQL